MIKKKTHEKLIKKWEEYGDVYQVRSERVKQRCKWFDTVAPQLKGLDVLDIGTNAGLFAIEAVKHTNTYWGLEPKAVYFNQCRCTLKSMKIEDKALISPTTFKEFFQKIAFKDSINGLILSRVLYWMNQHEVCKLQTMLPHIKVAIVICGKQEKSGNRNSFSFHKEENVAKFFLEAGMKWKKSLDHERLFGGVATR